MGDTIYALSTARGRAGIAVVRVSGPAAFSSAQALTGSPPPRGGFSLRRIINPATGETIDHALVLGFASPRSYTGEDTVEYHIHGGRAVTEELLVALSRQKNHRMADPGEFTRRAFENGKLDLTEAEAVADLIDAETQAQKNQALAQLSGQLSDIYKSWTDKLKNTLSHAEAEIEFPDEDLPESIQKTLAPAITALLAEIRAHLNDNRRGERLRDGVQVVIIGAPNAGKSSLLNALAQRDAAIVSDVAGTTRDVIEVHLDLGGYPVMLVDTAGLRPEHLDAQGHDKIENEGMKRALARAQNADIRLLLFDGSQSAPDAPTLALKDETALLVLNKADQGQNLALPAALKISALTGTGLEDLLKTLTARIETLIGKSETPSLTRSRHREALENCAACLERSLAAPEAELMAEDMRLAIRALGRITGRVDVEDLLDVIFRDFCIGK